MGRQAKNDYKIWKNNLEKYEKQSSGKYEENTWKEAKQKMKHKNKTTMTKKEEIIEGN